MRRLVWKKGVPNFPISRRLIGLSLLGNDNARAPMRIYGQQTLESSNLRHVKWCFHYVLFPHSWFPARCWRSLSTGQSSKFVLAPPPRATTINKDSLRCIWAHRTPLKPHVGNVIRAIQKAPNSNAYWVEGSVKINNELPVKIASAEFLEGLPLSLGPSLTWAIAHVYNKWDGKRQKER